MLELGDDIAPRQDVTLRNTRKDPKMFAYSSAMEPNERQLSELSIFMNFITIPTMERRDLSPRR